MLFVVSIRMPEDDNIIVLFGVGMEMTLRTILWL